MSRKSDMVDDTEQTDFTQFPVSLDAFLTRFANTEESYQCKLFELTRESGRQQQQYIKSWYNEIPSFDDVAEMGPGKYRITMTYTPKGKDTKPTSTSETISISPKYKANSGNIFALQSDVKTLDTPKNNDLIPLIVSMQQQSASMMAGMMQQFMSTIGNIIESREKKSGNNFAEINDMFSSVMMSNIEQQQSIIKKLTGQSIGQDLEDEDMEGPDSIIGWIKKIFDDYGEDILKAGPKLLNILRGQVQKDPRYQQVVNNPQIYKAAYDEIIESNPENKTKIDTILELLDAPQPVISQEQ